VGGGGGGAGGKRSRIFLKEERYTSCSWLVKKLVSQSASKLNEEQKPKCERSHVREKKEVLQRASEGSITAARGQDNYPRNLNNNYVCMVNQRWNKRKRGGTRGGQNRGDRNEERRTPIQEAHGLGGDYRNLKNTGTGCRRKKGPKNRPSPSFKMKWTPGGGRV